MVPDMLEKVKYLIVTGETAQKIADAVRNDIGYDPKKMPIDFAEDLAEAVQLARKFAKKGDLVFLCPACASFDRFPNFEARGKYYKELVMKL